MTKTQAADSTRTDYEALFIFPDRIKTEELDPVLKKTFNEIERLGGVIDNTTRLGRKSFARPMKKQVGGQYVVVYFQFDGSEIPVLLSRYKLNEDVFRVQITRALPPEEEDTPRAGDTSAGGTRHGDAE